MATTPIENDFTVTLPPELAAKYGESSDLITDMLRDFLGLKKQERPPQLFYQLADCLIQARRDIKQAQEETKRRRRAPKANHADVLAAIDEALEVHVCYSIEEAEQHLQTLGKRPVRMLYEADAVYIAPYLLTPSL